MSEKSRYKHKKNGKVAYFTPTAYNLLKDWYVPFPEDGEEVKMTTQVTTKKKEDAAGEDEELTKAREIWKGLFKEDPNPRKILKTLQKEIDEASGNNTEK